MPHRAPALPFTKMHGAGNDFMIVDARADALPLSPALIRALGDRRTGVGWDQLIVLRPSARADASMRIYNPDGSEAGACGNATRCVADLLGREAGRASLTVETAAGILHAELDDAVVQVDMGPPRFGWQDVPLGRAYDTLCLPIPGEPAALSMGNPHATLFVADVGAVDVPGRGAALERNAIFPDRANIGFAQVMAPDRIRLRVWERGAGLTRACGSGACAALVNAHRRGLTGRNALVVLDGGTLTVTWREADGHVLMAGPAATAFQGIVDLSSYPA